MPYRKSDIETALKHLRKRDQVMRDIIDRVGEFTLKTKRDYFALLVRSIVSQQISTAAARTILSRLTDHVAPHKISATAIAALSIDQLRSLGVSQQKATYVLDLARHVNDGLLDLSRLSRMTDDQIIESLVAVKGIGVWTAQMFLIFAIGRLDVLPVGDLGIKNAIARRYGFEESPTSSEMIAVAQPWRPYASIASWYLWRSLELPDHSSK